MVQRPQRHLGLQCWSLVTGKMASKFIPKVENVIAEPDSRTVSCDEMHKLLRSIEPEGTNTAKKKHVPPSAQPTMLFICRDLSMVSPVNRYDLVYPGIIIGDHRLAYDKPDLGYQKVTHVLNAAQGQKFAQIDTTEAYYADLGLKFMGINVMDTARSQISVHFEEAAAFINDAVSSGGKVFVHCFQGISRSSSLVLAYLMICEKMPLRQAIKTIRKRRAIYPNDGFLKQLVALNNSLFATGAKAESKDRNDKVVNTVDDGSKDVTQTSTKSADSQPSGNVAEMSEAVTADEAVCGDETVASDNT